MSVLAEKKLARPTRLSRPAWRDRIGLLSFEARKRLWRCEDIVRDQFAKFQDCLPQKVLLTSVPKAGTHLVMEALRHFQELIRRPLMLEPYLPLKRHEAQLAHMARNRFAWGHLPASPSILRMAAEMDLKVIVMLRDPRDVVVSFVDHVHRNPHILRDYFESLPDQTARLKAAILGVPAEVYRRDSGAAAAGYYDGYTGFTDIGSVIRNYLLWEKHDNILMVHFENLIGEKGGGNSNRQRAELEKIISFLGLKNGDARLEAACAGIFNERAPTFNLGRQGRWKELFSDEVKFAFKDVASEEVRTMGYEKDDNW